MASECIIIIDLQVAMRIRNVQVRQSPTGHLLIYQSIPPMAIAAIIHRTSGIAYMRPPTMLHMVQNKAREQFVAFAEEQAMRKQVGLP